jgi:hypothetical protein
MCNGHGIEVNRNFVVSVKHEGKPLQGVTVKVTDGTAALRFSGETDSMGSLLITTLPPGDYWLDASFLGINAAYYCFHVSEHSSLRAKHRMKYEWGDFAEDTRRIAGSLVDSQPGTGENSIWNVIHRVKVPITDARLTLQNPFTRKTLSATSDENGAFAIDGVPAGTYVLHIEGGTGGRQYEPTDLLIRLSPSASSDTLELTRREPGGGSCGTTYLELLNRPPAANP